MASRREANEYAVIGHAISKNANPCAFHGIEQESSQKIALRSAGANAVNETDFLVAITRGLSASGRANYGNSMIGKANADAVAQRVGIEHVA